MSAMARLDITRYHAALPIFKLAAASRSKWPMPEPGLHNRHMAHDAGPLVANDGLLPDKDGSIERAKRAIPSHGCSVGRGGGVQQQKQEKSGVMQREACAL